MVRPGILLAAVSLAASASAAAPPASIDQTSVRILEIHNAERALYGAPPLRWDPLLAQSASAYALVLARTGQLIHSPRESRRGQSENLSEAYRGSSAEGLVRLWLAERRNFTPGVFPNVSRTGNWYDVSHYSQLIWPTTLYLGCGVARGRQWDYIVCRYSPGGNKDGKPVGIRPSPYERG